LFRATNAAIPLLVMPCLSILYPAGGSLTTVACVSTIHWNEELCTRFWIDENSKLDLNSKSFLDSANGPPKFTGLLTSFREHYWDRAIPVMMRMLKIGIIYTQLMLDHKGILPPKRRPDVEYHFMQNRLRPLPPHRSRLLLLPPQWTFPQIRLYPQVVSGLPC